MGIDDVSLSYGDFAWVSPFDCKCILAFRSTYQQVFGRLRCA